MNLPFFKKKSSGSLPPREYFFALEISHSTVKSAIWSVINSKTQVLSVGSLTTWDGLASESLSIATDQSISDASTRLDPQGKISPDKVIFGLPTDWLSQEKIIPEKLKLLRTLTEQLSLKAVGFVITPDAAVRFIQHTEGVPPTAILIGFWPDQIEVTLVRLGKIDGVQLVKRSTHVVADVVEGLTRFTNIDMYPSRMLLYDSGQDLEEYKQRLLAHAWQAPQTRLTFLHFPKIETLPPDFTIRAVATSGGAEVARAIGLITENPVEDTIVPKSTTPQLTPQELGFFPETDIAMSKEDLPEVERPVYIPPPIVETALEIVAPEEPDVETPPEFIPFPHSKKKFSFPKFRFNIIPIILLIIAIFGGILAAYWYLPKAAVTLTLVPKSLDAQFDLVVDTLAKEVNSDSRTIPGVYKEVDTGADKSSATTGTKLVGDKATGSVTIINGTSVPRTFPVGTSISVSGGPSFVFDTEIQVASASGTADPNSYQPGKASVNVTASQIGSDSNLSAGTSFRVGSYSTLDYVAKNDAAFAGGTSRQVKVVSKEDISKLRADLTASLKEEAKKQLTTQISEAEELLNDTVTTQTIAEDLNHQEGSQADSVTMRLTVKAKGLTFKKSDLNTIVNNQTKSQVPDGYVSVSEFENTFTTKKTDKTSVTLAIQVSGSLLPRIAEKEIINNLVGKSPLVARNYLSSLSGVSRIDIAFSIPLPDFLLTLPRQPSNISLQVQSQ